MSHNNKGATKKKSNQNYSTSLAGGGSVSVKNGVKTYSDKAQTVSGNNGISISGKSYSRDKGGTGFAPITPEQLNSSTPAFTLPKETVTNFTDPTANYGGFTGGDSSLTTQNGQLVTATPLPTADNKYGSITDTFNKIMAEQAKIAPPSGGDIQRQLEKETKINQLRKQEANYSNQLNTITANRDANVLRVEGQGRGIPEAIIGGQQAKINKEAAIQALPVQAQLAAAQGNVALAEAHINTWGKILMDDATNQYNYKKDLLKSVGDFALNIESKKIDDLNLKIEQKYKSEQALVTAKVEAQKMALGQGAPSAISDAIRAATTLEEVATATGKYNADVLAQEAQRANIAQSYSSIATDKLQRQKLVNEINNTGNEGISADLEAYGNQFAETGVLPSPAVLKASGLNAGQISSYAKQIPKTSGTLVSKNTGTKTKEVGAAEQADLNRLYNIVQMTKSLAELDKKRVGGVISGVFGKLTGSNDQGAYITQRKAIVDEMSRMQSGAALTPDEVAIYNDYLPSRFSEPLGFGRNSDKVIEDFSNTMTQKLDNALANNQLSIYGHTKVTIPEIGTKTVGEVIDVGGTKYKVLPDGTLTDII